MPNKQSGSIWLIILICLALVLPLIITGLWALSPSNQGNPLPRTSNPSDKKPTPSTPTVSVVSPDGQKTALVKTVGNKKLVSINGQEGRQYDNVEGLQFSADSQDLFYIAQNNSKVMLVINNSESHPYDHLGLDIGSCYAVDRPAYFGIITSLTGHSYALCASVNGETIVVHNGVESEPYGAVALLTLSPDGTRDAYRSYKNKADWGNSLQAQEYVVVDQNKFGPYWPDGAPGSAPFNQPIFSPDSKHFAFIAQRNPTGDSIQTFQVETFLVEDGVKQKDYYGIWQPIFNSTSTQLAYVATSQDPPHQKFLVINGIEQRYYDDILDHQFSPDGQHLAYIASLGDQHYIILDGKVVKQYTPSGPTTYHGEEIKFSPNNSLQY